MSEGEHPYILELVEEPDGEFVFIYDDERNIPGAPLVAFRRDNALRIAAEIGERFA